RGVPGTRAWPDRVHDRPGPGRAGGEPQAHRRHQTSVAPRLAGELCRAANPRRWTQGSDTSVQDWTQGSDPSVQNQPRISARVRLSPAAIAERPRSRSPWELTSRTPRTRPRSRYQTEKRPSSGEPLTISSSHSAAPPTYSSEAQSARSEKKYGTVRCSSAAPS